jgi:hypothetical protein
MSRINIGTSGKGKIAWLDVDLLLRTRLLIQANSGKGKSWLLRRMAEQLFGKVQVIIIDPEGEFATLREKYAYVLVGKGGETAAHPRIAALTAQRLLELHASAVCDIYELKPAERHAYVKAFLDALIDAPKKLWHPVVIILDEAHVYCPEKGAGESEASDAVISMATRGRKRGFCLIPATQRLGKLRKDVAAELLNVAIGGTFIDIDRKRAADALGVYGKKEVPAFFNEIRQLERGKFYFLGPAVSTERLLVTVGDVETTHPEAGSAKHAAELPPAPDKVKAMLPKLADLPKEAEEKARTEAEFRREIRELKAQISVASRQQASTKAPAAAKSDPISARTVQLLRAALKEATNFMAKIASFDLQAAAVDRQQVEALVKSVVDRVLGLSAQASAAQQKKFEHMRREAKPILDKLQRLLDEKPQSSAVLPSPQAPPATSPRAAAPRPAIASNGGDRSLGSTNRRMAAILAAYYPQSIDKALLASMCGKSVGGGWNGRISETRAAGLLEDVAGGMLRATDECVRLYGGQWSAPTTTQEAIAVWNHKLSDRHRAMLNRLIEADGEPVSKEDLAAAAGMSLGGGFNGRLSELRSTGLMIDAGRGMFKANKQALFLENVA